MKTIKIAFVGFWKGFIQEHNFITDILQKHMDVTVIDVKKDSSRKKEVQYLFFSCFSDEYLDYSCVRIFFTGENVAPDFNICDYAIGFDYITLQDRYIRLPLYLAMYDQDVEHMIQKTQHIEEKLKDRKFCSMVVSNVKDAENKRKEFFDLLLEYQKVDSGGRYLNNIGIPEGVADKEKFQNEYKFSITFENSSHPGYCTEKIVQGFAAKTVPIYWGDPTIAEQFNPKAFINCHEYGSLEEVVEAVKNINENDELYMQMLKENAIIGDRLTELKHEFEDWLIHIFEQEYEGVFRRNRYGRCLLYEKQQLHIRELKELEDREYNKFSARMIRKFNKVFKKNN